MMAAVDHYLGLRRIAGFVLCNAQYLLRSFATFAAERQEQHVRTATLIDWAARASSSPASASAATTSAAPAPPRSPRRAPTA